MNLCKSFVVLVLFSTLTVAKSLWGEKPFSEWSFSEVDSILNHSPWVETTAAAQAMDISKLGNSLENREGSATCSNLDSGVYLEEVTGNSGAAVSSKVRPGSAREYVIRFVSAFPIRMAIARFAALKHLISPEIANSFVEQDPFGGYIVVSLSASSEEDQAELNQFATYKLGEETLLLLGNSGKKIFAERYISPNRSAIGEALFFFERTRENLPLIVASEKKLTFKCKVSRRTELEKTFDLERMVIKGKLEI